MPDLLAQTTAAAPGLDWERLLMGYGPLGLIVGLLFYFVLRYSPRVINAHVQYVETTAGTQKKIADALESLSETAAAHGVECKIARKAVKHIALAAKQVVDKSNTEAHKHLDNASRDSWVMEDMP